jgi:nucleoside-diphosphate-sugar epimerase
MNGTFCIGNLRSYSINEVIKILEQIFGYDVKQNTRKEMWGEVYNIEINTKKARMGLHFHCRYSFLDGIKETCDWYREKKYAD